MQIMLFEGPAPAGAIALLAAAPSGAAAYAIARALRARRLTLLRGG